MNINVEKERREFAAAQREITPRFKDFDYLDIVDIFLLEFKGWLAAKCAIDRDAIRNAALEEAAQICDALFAVRKEQQRRRGDLKDIAQSIRALLSVQSSEPTYAAGAECDRLNAMCDLHYKNGFDAGRLANEMGDENALKSVEARGLEALRLLKELRTAQPAGTTGSVFGAPKRFDEWFSTQQFTGMSAREIASLAFDEGHLFWHEKEIPYSTMSAVKAVEAEAVVPEGWQLVPIKPTEKMLGAVMAYPWELLSNANRDSAPRRYAAMLHAAPVAAASVVEGKVKRKIEEYDVNGSWYKCHSIDEMQAFYLSRLPAIREAARECGYAIGLHGSARRDFDLMAMQWTDDCSTPDELACAIAKAACGITRDGLYRWEKKSPGRIATSFAVCWTDHSENFPKDMLSLGHIDLSLIAPLVEADAQVTHCSTKYLSKLQRDAERLDWFDKQVIGYGFDGIQDGNSWMIDGPYGSVRDAIDACMADDAIAAQSKEKK